MNQAPSRIALWKKIPIEFLVLFVATIVSLSLVSLSRVFEIADVATSSTVVVVLYVWLKTLLVFGLLSVFVGAFLLCKKIFPDKRLIYWGISFMSFLLILHIFFRLTSVLIASAFASVNGGYTIAVSLWYLHLDTQLRVYSFLDYFIELVISVPYLVWVLDLYYSFTVVAVVGTLFMLAFHSAKNAREFVFTLIVAKIVALPFWIVLPAMAPLQLATFESVALYDTVQLIPEQTAVVTDLYAKYQNTYWANVVTGWDTFWKQTYDLGWGFPISSNPSMHIIWGVLMAFYLRKMHWFVGILGVNFLLMEAIGTMLFLQHYSIDLIGGLLAAFLTIYLTKKLLRYEKSHLAVNEKAWFSFLYYLERCGSQITTLLSRRKK